jgi:peptidoglycan/LPS O-acetylase OafA/YrhL
LKKTLRHAKELDGVRGLAALSVFVLHVFITARDAVPPSAISPGWRLLNRLAGLGTLGVDVFFVLSGFLITSLLLLDRDKAHYFRNFYWKRVLRIQPVYLIHMALAWFLLPGSHGYVVLGLVFLVNFDTYFKVPDVGPAWTLSIEEQFYLLWPQVVRRVSLARLYHVSIAVMICSSVLRIGMVLIAHHAMLRSTWYRFDGLAMGALMACQWIGEGEGQTGWTRRFLPLFNSTGALAAAIAWEALFVFGIGNSIGLAMFPTNYLCYRLIGYVMAHPGSRWFGWLGAAPLVFLGAISYSLYMMHTIFLYLYDTRVAAVSLDPASFAIRAGVVAVAAIAACAIIRYTVELPAQSLRRFVIRRS